PAVRNCEEAIQYCSHIPGLPSKNLFLHDPKSNRFFLIVLPAYKRLDLKKLAKTVAASRLVFASPQKLEEILKLKPGAVSLFGLLNDPELTTELYIDLEVYNAETVSFHPNLNTKTLGLSKPMLEKFLKTIKHKTAIIKLPAL
ncbi:MAG: YbaK/EbsC family protein, partial [Parachlamydiales bacterium]